MPRSFRYARIVRCLLIAALPRLAGQVPSIEPGQTVEGRLAAGEVRGYLLRADAGQFVAVKLSSFGAEFRARLLAPDGPVVAETGSLDGLALAGLTETAGDYRLEVRAARGEVRYRVHLSALRAATPKDRGWLAAAQIYREAAELRARGQAEHLRRSIDKYRDALSAFRASGDQAGEASALVGLGRAYDGLSERKKALEFYEPVLPLYRALGDQAGESYALGLIALAYDYVGQRDRDASSVEQSLHAAKAAGDIRAEAMALTNAGQVYYDRSEKRSISISGRSRSNARPATGAVKR